MEDKPWLRHSSLACAGVNSNRETVLWLIKERDSRDAGGMRGRDLPRGIAVGTWRRDRVRVLGSDAVFEISAVLDASNVSRLISLRLLPVLPEPSVFYVQVHLSQLCAERAVPPRPLFSPFLRRTAYCPSSRPLLQPPHSPLIPSLPDALRHLDERNPGVSRAATSCIDPAL